MSHATTLAPLPGVEPNWYPPTPPPKGDATRDAMARAFNEWMRRYTDEPARFAADFHTIGAFLSQDARGEEPTYGDTCAAYLIEIMREQSGVAGRQPSDK